MQKENIIKIDNIDYFNTESYFTDNITFEKMTVFKQSGMLHFCTEAVNKNFKWQVVLSYNIVDKIFTIEARDYNLKDFLEYQKLINQALDYITTYTKTIENN
jgi:hypothetical protein